MIVRKLSFAGAVLFLSSVLISQAPPPKDWIDADTGHRIVRLTDDAGGSTLYFHDNAFSPQGDKLMFTTPKGIAVVDVSKIGTNDLHAVVIASGRGGYFSRRTREIYYNSTGEGVGNGRGNGSGAVTAVNVDTKQTREV